jgi:hypothetical protein
MQHVQDLLSRMETLERQNRSLKRWAFAALAFTSIGILASAAAVCDSVSAERFLVRDSRGKERVRLTAYETGGVPKLSFFDDKGKTVFSLGVCEKNSGYIEVNGANGLARSAFKVQDGCAVLEPVSKSTSSGEPKVGM